MSPSKVRILKKSSRCVSCSKLIASGEKSLDHGNGIKEHLLCARLAQDYIGELGILERDEEGRPRCHICGWYMEFLAKHVEKKHGLRASEYKELFGLNRQTPLCSYGYSNFHAAIGLHNQEGGKFPSGEDGKRTLYYPGRYSSRVEELLLRRAIFNNPMDDPEIREKQRKARRKHDG